MDDERRVSALVLVSGTLLAVVVVLGALLVVVSPASFVSLVPGRLGGSASWVIAGAGALAAAILAAPRGRGQGLRATMITVLLIIAGLSAVHALKTAAEDPPAEENTCVAYSGGSQTCPGG